MKIQIILGVMLLGCSAKDKKPEERLGCFTQVERKEGWEQQEITCNYRPDSATHEWREFKNLNAATPKDAANDSNPFSYRPRGRRWW